MTDVETVKGWVHTLAHGQGSYGRMLASIEESENPDGMWQNLTDAVNGSGVTDIVGFVMFIEG